MTRYIDAKLCAEELGVPLSKLKRLARKGEFPELLRVDRGTYRVPEMEYESWKQSRMTSAEMARSELLAARDRELLSRRYP